jgi:hypothetical protein
MGYRVLQVDVVLSNSRYTGCTKLAMQHVRLACYCLFHSVLRSSCPAAALTATPFLTLPACLTDSLQAATSRTSCLRRLSSYSL